MTDTTDPRIELREKYIKETGGDVYSTDSYPSYIDWLELQICGSPGMHPTVGEKFKMPTTEQLVNIAIIFNEKNGIIDKEQMADMLGMTEFVLDRLYENNDVMIPTKKEIEDENKGV